MRVASMALLSRYRSLTGKPRPPAFKRAANRHFSGLGAPTRERPAGGGNAVGTFPDRRNSASERATGAQAASTMPLASRMPPEGRGGMPAVAAAALALR